MANILVDVCHPAHAHFFRHPIGIWRSQGHAVHVASRDKDVAIALLDAFGFEHRSLGRAASSPIALVRELVRRDIALWRFAREVRADVITGLGGIFAAHVGLLARIPSVIFYDTEIARWQNRLTYPIAHRVVVPRCYTGWVPAATCMRYPGYHELSYLHPDRFKPSRDRALAAGLDAERPTFLLRLVSWTANHDVGEKGFDLATVRMIISRLAKAGKVLVSSEGDLPEDLVPLRYSAPASEIHHLMAFAAGYFGESATMASECAVLGVPAVYAANSGRGYTDEQEARYGLVRNVRTLDREALESGLQWLLSRTRPEAERARLQMLDECVDVAEFAARTVLAEIRHTEE